jgi:hypothetical protein
VQFSGKEKRELKYYILDFPQYGRHFSATIVAKEGAMGVTIYSDEFKQEAVKLVAKGGR